MCYYDQLLPHVEGPAKEVDLVQLDPDRLTLPQSGSSTQHDQSPRPRLDGVDQVHDRGPAAVSQRPSV